MLACGKALENWPQLKAATAATGNDPAIEATLKSWAARATQLKQRLEQMPDKKIPELQLLTDKDWFDAIKDPKQLETDDDFRQALNNLRNSAKNAFGDMTREAMKKYAEANNGQLPGDLSQLKPLLHDAGGRRHAPALFTSPNGKVRRCAGGPSPVRRESSPRG